MLSEKVEKKEFTNKILAEVVYNLCLLEEEFNNKKQGQVLAGHLLSLSTTFREDQRIILKIIQNNDSSNLKLQKKQKMRQVIKHSAAKDSRVTNNKCKTCGKTSFENSTMPIKKYEIPLNMEKLKANNWREVLNTFGSDIDSMIVFCRLNGVRITDVGKPELIAKDIFNELSKNK